MVKATRIVKRRHFCVIKPGNQGKTGQTKINVGCLVLVITTTLTSQMKRSFMQSYWQDFKESRNGLDKLKLLCDVWGSKDDN